MDETNKAIIIAIATLGFFLTLIFGLDSWARYETAKLDYICVPE
jgi:hypothetical protein